MDTRGAVVVTGASSGIGRAAALLLARRGWLVFAGVRRASDGAALAVAAGALGVGALLLPRLLDVTDAASVAAAADEVGVALAARGIRLTGLVNNAGIAVAGPLEEVPIARLRQVLEVNVVGAVAVTQALLPLLRQGRGRIVNISSVAGRVASPFLGPYAASKFALEALSDALRVELAPWGLAVVLIEPGPVATSIWGKGEALVEADRVGVGDDSPYAPRIEQLRAAFRRNARRGMAAEAVAEVIVRALEVPHPRVRYMIGRNRVAVALLARLVPDRLRDRILTGRSGGRARQGRR